MIELLVEKVVGRSRWFINAENLLDERQTRYDSLVLPARGRGLPGSRFTGVAKAYSARSEHPSDTHASAACVN